MSSADGNFCAGGTPTTSKPSGSVFEIGALGKGVTVDVAGRVAVGVRVAVRVGVLVRVLVAVAVLVPVAVGTTGNSFDGPCVRCCMYIARNAASMRKSWAMRLREHHRGGTPA